MNVESDVRAYLLSEHRSLVVAVLSCAEAVEGTPDDRLGDYLEACLRESGVFDRLPNVLAGAVDAAGEELRARPVAGPPYVVVTGVGPVLRATLDPGRLVVTVAAFEKGPSGYVRAGRTPEEALRVELR
ncbi:hypothetical protein [Halomarina litorea]|uniref:hypothetical protein n=1 Tax=Halomarina litorea TaxID=2961595 RepID=UPI0020C1F980|nr:hypothetical protein [Halomarina sp. BCD28]